MTQETVHVLDPCCGSRMMWFDHEARQAPAFRPGRMSRWLGVGLAGRTT